MSVGFSLKDYNPSEDDSKKGAQKGYGVNFSPAALVFGHVLSGRVYGLRHFDLAKKCGTGDDVKWTRRYHKVVGSIESIPGVGTVAAVFDGVIGGVLASFTSPRQSSITSEPDLVDSLIGKPSREAEGPLTEKVNEAGGFGSKALFKKEDTVKFEVDLEKCSFVGNNVPGDQIVQPYLERLGATYNKDSEIWTFRNLHSKVFDGELKVGRAFGGMADGDDFLDSSVELLFSINKTTNKVTLTEKALEELGGSQITALEARFKDYDVRSLENYSFIEPSESNQVNAFKVLKVLGFTMSKNGDLIPLGTIGKDDSIDEGEAGKDKDFFYLKSKKEDPYKLVEIDHKNKKIILNHDAEGLFNKFNSEGINI